MERGFFIGRDVDDKRFRQEERRWRQVCLFITARFRDGKLIRVKSRRKRKSNTKKSSK